MEDGEQQALLIAEAQQRPRAGADRARGRGAGAPRRGRGVPPRPRARRAAGPRGGRRGISTGISADDPPGPAGRRSPRTGCAGRRAAGRSRAGRPPAPGELEPSRAAGRPPARCRRDSPAPGGRGTRGAAGRRRAGRRLPAGAEGPRGGARSPLPFPQGALDLPREIGEDRRLKQSAQRQLQGEGLAETGDELGGEQGVAAQIEEVVVPLRSPRGSRNTCAQRPHSTSSTGVRGAVQRRAAAGPPVPGGASRRAGRARRSTFPWR